MEVIARKNISNVNKKLELDLKNSDFDDFIEFIEINFPDVQKLKETELIDKLDFQFLENAKSFLLDMEPLYNKASTVKKTLTYIHL